MAQAKNYWIWQKSDFGKWLIADDQIHFDAEQCAIILGKIKHLAGNVINTHNPPISAAAFNQ
jgi:hypothetical protein